MEQKKEGRWRAEQKVFCVKREYNKRRNEP